ncbi:uncharacterized protein LOC121241434 [Juglans microcarpa x Juglans regia]|uniref:uncharacterized protein LOC121241434 n=1 Tax=Juglans microcarpa x Juglans regia TaxID=2249226 RepID=UPI001B7F47DB|nr:uncharacterized protein LOC121241434 [Juglans microcarpa x Juglans regia]
MELHSVFETQETPVASTEPPSPPQPPMSSSVPSSKPQPLRSFVFSNFKWPLEYPSSTTAANHHNYHFCNVLSESTPDSEPHANDPPAVNEDHTSLAVRELADATLFPGSEPQLAHPLKYDHHSFGKLAGSTRTRSKSRCRNDPGPDVTNGLSFVGSSERLIVKEAKKIPEKKPANSIRVMLKPGDKSKAPDPKPKIYIRISTKNKSTADGAAKATEQTSPVAAEVKELPPKPWNLRPRKPSPKSLHGDGVGVASRAGGAPAQETKTQHPVRASARARKGTNSKVSEEIPRLSIALSKEEIEEDILLLTGSKPARRPNKRAKTVQKQLDSVFPGLGLSSITPESYNVSVAPGKV